jgi:hypothetical protein
MIFQDRSQVLVSVFHGQNRCFRVSEEGYWKDLVELVSISIFIEARKSQN